MSLILKIILPVLVVVGVVTLYMTKYPGMIADTKAAPPQEMQAVPVSPAQIRTNEQLALDLIAIDAELSSASDVSATAQTFNDTPVAQSE